MYVAYYNAGVVVVNSEVVSDVKNISATSVREVSQSSFLCSTLHFCERC
jgi:hypothetical protein